MATVSFHLQSRILEGGAGISASSHKTPFGRSVESVCVVWSSGVRQFSSAVGLSSKCSSELQPFSCNRGTGLQVVSMARERRVKMVSQQIKREISEMLLYDKVLQEAILPESALGADMYLSSVATISDVEISKDLSVAKVYISVYGDERGQDLALAGLKKREGYVRKGIAQRMNLKFTPEIRFLKDEALERGSRVLSILEKLKQEREAKEKGTNAGGDDEEDEDREEGELEDEEVEEEEEEEDARISRSQSSDDGDETDWVEKDENITFIR